MRLGDAPESGNFEDRTGQSGGGGLSLGGAGGGLFGLLAQFVLSRFGLVGLLILGLGYCALSSLGGGLGGGSMKEGPSQLDPNTGKFMREVLGSTEQVWGDIFKKAGAQYTPTRLVAYSDYNQSGCGAAQAAMGPFYCPTDKQIYIDPAFFQELSQRFQAPGDFAQAYVIAHEVGHHVQDLEGTLDQVGSAQARSDKVSGNQLQVGVELQADCYAGVWAANAKDANGQLLLEPGDVEEGMRAAEAIGDDTLQKQMQGRVVPDSFTHGSSAQRMEALQRGLKSGNPGACNYTR
ncbi:KPN_02809 family neutral zinc metallopeptidase [Sphingomonas jaspsi]|uniref:KPN_02809 family neutral zinc metallopeptidase n=1 Tax=Sphingomonas jaspsi TaxID=392409 RepID=UPI0004B0ECC9|nr:neutral zinc metallopeptidase [Sphingomonas jaspsi]